MREVLPFSLAVPAYGRADRGICREKVKTVSQDFDFTDGSLQPILVGWAETVVPPAAADAR